VYRIFGCGESDLIQQGTRQLHNIFYQVLPAVKESLRELRPAKPVRLQYFPGRKFQAAGYGDVSSVHPLTKDTLTEVLSNPVFEKITIVDWIIDGRRDTLVTPGDLMHAFVSALPRLERVRLRTRPCDFDLLRKDIAGMAESSNASNTVPEVMLFLQEGVGCARRQSDEMSAASEIVRYLRVAEIPVSARYVLNADNCFHADDFLLWCDGNGVTDWAFGVALPAGEKVLDPDKIFSGEQQFHLAMFFEGLVSRRKMPLAKRQFYEMMAEGFSGKGHSGVSCKKPPPVVSLDRFGGVRLARRFFALPGIEMEKREKNPDGGDGSDEVHHQADVLCEPAETPGLAYIFRRGKQAAGNLIRQRGNHVRSGQIFPQVLTAPQTTHPQSWKHVLITGWYGTETAGDKAILGELLHFLKTNSPEIRITLTTLNERVSIRTQMELEALDGAALVDLHHAHRKTLIESVDAVIIGGGPLMESQAMEQIWRIFSEANKQRKARIIFGCGVGPLHSAYITRLTDAVLQMATAGFFRDIASFDYAKKIAPNARFGFACDPAFAYVRRWAEEHPLQTDGKQDARKRIAGLLRANTREFVPGQSGAGMDALNRETAGELANILETACIEGEGVVELLPMNTPWLGGDDRLFNRQVASAFEGPQRVHVERRYLSLNRLIDALRLADVAVAMRYHGHIFCAALGIPFLSINYTGKNGKVQSLMQRLDTESWSEDWNTIDTEKAARLLVRAIREREALSEFLSRQADEMVADLQKVYAQVFDVQAVE